MLSYHEANYCQTARRTGRLRDEAARRGLTVSELTREAIQRHLGGGSRRRLAGGKAWRSGQHDVSERIEELLGSELRQPG